MFKKLLLLILPLLIILNGCSILTEQPDKKQGKDSQRLSESVNADNYFLTVEEVQAIYPQKEILVWVIESTIYDRQRPFRMAEFNEYLDKLGCDYAVCFKPVKTEDWNTPYAFQINELISNGEQADIIYSSVTYPGESGCNAYHKFIYNGLFEPLDDYFKTGPGKKLYDLMPENHWAGLRVNGKIYGVDGALNTLRYDYGIFYNTDLLEKYDYDISKSPLEQTDILDIIKNTEDCDVFTLYRDFNIPLFYSDIREIVRSVYWEQTEQAAKSVFDCAEYTEKLRMFFELHKQGLISDDGNPQKSSFLAMQKNIQGGFSYVKNTPIIINYLEDQISVTPFFNDRTTIIPSWSATGICSASSKKDKAFELLALTQTDADLNNLLTFGIEGTDYSLVDGKTDNIINYISLDRFANKMICCSYGDEPLNMESFYRTALENASIPENISFAFDGRGTEKETEQTVYVLNELRDVILSGKYSDFGILLSDYREKLNNAGVRTIIEECERQYHEWENMIGEYNQLT